MTLMSLHRAQNAMQTMNSDYGPGCLPTFDSDGSDLGGDGSDSTHVLECLRFLDFLVVWNRLLSYDPDVAPMCAKYNATDE